jgi:hypothetical protein
VTCITSAVNGATAELGPSSIVTPELVVNVNPPASTTPPPISRPMRSAPTETLVLASTSTP